MAAKPIPQMVRKQARIHGQDGEPGEHSPPHCIDFQLEGGLEEEQDQNVQSKRGFFQTGSEEWTKTEVNE